MEKAATLQFWQRCGLLPTHANLLTGGLDKAMALRKAQIDMIRADAKGALAMNAKRGFTTAEDGGTGGSLAIPQSHPYH